MVVGVLLAADDLDVDALLDAAELCSCQCLASDHDAEGCRACACLARCWCWDLSDEADEADEVMALELAVRCCLPRRRPTSQAARGPEPTACLLGQQKLP